MFFLNKSDHISEYYQELRWLRVSQLIQFRLAYVMYHQYNAFRGIMFVLLIQFENCTLYNTRTPSYYANLRRVRLSQTQKQGRYQGALVWNKFLSELKEPMSYMNFYNYMIFVCSFFLCLLFVCSVCVYCICMYVCMYVFDPPMRKSGYADHCEVKIINQINLTMCNTN